ncbi:MAG: DUF3493 domain-containing protein [Cyanobacteriota bacterium ELA615]|jgi:hypothetical protein
MQSPKEPRPYDRLRAEAKAPYRYFRWFIYVALGSSGLIGAIVFLVKIISGSDVQAAIPNFFLQIGVMSLMIWLISKDRPKIQS